MCISKIINAHILVHFVPPQVPLQQLLQQTGTQQQPQIESVPWVPAPIQPQPQNGAPRRAAPRRAQNAAPRRAQNVGRQRQNTINLNNGNGITRRRTTPIVPRRSKKFLIALKINLRNPNLNILYRPSRIHKLENNYY